MAIHKKVTVVDCKDHLLGRLAAKVAKELLQGKKIACVRTELINISGPHSRNKLKFLSFLRKKCNTNPTRGGPWHLRSPARMFWRVVRGMLPHKTKRGALALARLQVYEGIPPPYDRVRRVVVPRALRVTKLRPQRPYTILGELASEVGWKYKDVVDRLESKRKVRSAAFHIKKKALFRNLSKARARATTKLPEQTQKLLASVEFK
eukprot:TRINITY_DN316_c0_g1_i2.p1 TRINITY_DN316_c0_g1~~TRINITY_DN316_c0_g1_i2.p1  ORF type:complete len:206 (-),score=35.01 TRINITY_DN316_c0_g1_i2:55-672(-)